MKYVFFPIAKLWFILNHKNMISFFAYSSIQITTNFSVSQNDTKEYIDVEIPTFNVACVSCVFSLRNQWKEGGVELAKSLSTFKTHLRPAANWNLCEVTEASNVFMSLKVKDNLKLISTETRQREDRHPGRFKEDHFYEIIEFISYRMDMFPRWNVCEMLCKLI